MKPNDNVDGKAGEVFDPSAMDRRVTIERDSGTTINEVGEVVKSWASVATVWAEVVPVTGYEASRMGYQVATQMVRLRMRYIDGVQAKDRVSYRSSKYDVLYIREVGRKRWLELTAENRN